MEMKTFKPAFYLLVAMIIPFSSAHAEIKCWYNKDNVRECGQAVPPEYSQKRIEVINDKGITVKVYPAKEELDEIRRQNKLREAEERKKAAKRRQDLILLQTYTTEDDLLLAKKQNLQAIDAIIDLTGSNTSVLKNDLKTLEKNAADYERSGENPPAQLIKDMDNLKRQIKENEEFIKKKELAKKETSDKFDMDLKRFRELKGIKSGNKGTSGAVKP
ncbi:MAG: hypothetical protein P8Y24_10860 [Gammaproteobacteria bacterium]